MELLENEMTSTTPGAELRIGATRCYGEDWFRELTIGGITFLAPLDQQDRARHLLAARELPAASLGEETFYGLRFGHGGLAVSTGTYKGEPCVFIREAPEPQPLGKPVPSELELPLRAVLCFPTKEQAKVVQDALVPSPTPSATGSGDAVVVGENGWIDPTTRTHESLVDCALQNYVRASHYRNPSQHDAAMACRAEILRRLEATPPAKPEAGEVAYPTGSDREVLQYLMQQFDAETWECEHCGHGETTATMDSASYLRNYLAAKAEGDGGEDDGSSAFAKGREVFWKQRRSERSSKEAEAAFDEYHRKLKATTQATQP